jgi:hypothetical protein
VTEELPERDDLPEGYGCKPTVTALGLLVAFVVIAATVGVSLALGDGCDGLCETAGFTLYASALPVSALFAFFAGDLPVAWPLDTTFWVIASFLIGRYAEQRGMSVPAAVVRAIVAALVYGFVIALFLESIEA